MPSTVRVSATDLVTTVRLRDFPRRWIDAYVSHDDGRSWSYLSTPAPDIGQGNPPCLVRLADGRLCLTYGYRGLPFAIHARLSSDQGKTWTDPFVLRGNGGSQDIGYPRSVVRPDGKVVTVYAFHDRAGSVRDCHARAVWIGSGPAGSGERAVEQSCDWLAAVELEGASKLVADVAGGVNAQAR